MVKPIIAVILSAVVLGAVQTARQYEAYRWWSTLGYYQGSPPPLVRMAATPIYGERE